jgi:radical SAM superfamily enzyme YgiQ (UPF0313 family)
MLEKKLIDRKDFRVLLGYPNFTKMLTPSTAVAIFTAKLKGEKYATDLFDCTPYLTSYNPQDMPNPQILTQKLMSNKPVDPEFFQDVKYDLFGDFRKKMNDFRPHAVIFSTVVEDTWPQARDLLKVLHDEYPQVKTLIGGVYSTMVPQQVIANPYTQVVGFGEGEETVVDFCESVRNKRPLTNIPGTFARDEDGKVIYNSPRKVIDINKSPIPDFSLFDRNRFRRPLGRPNPADKDGMWVAIPVETYRGCPYNCAFCNSPIQRELAEEREQGDFLRRKSMDYLRTEIITLLEQTEGNFLYFLDDAFMARPMPEIDAFIEMYDTIRDSKGKHIPFWMQTRFEDIRDEKQLARLKQVGLHHASFGLEHGNEEFRRQRLKRNISNEKMVEKARIIQRVDIPYQINVIIGMPYETRPLVFDTIELAREVGGFDAIAPNLFMPYKGTTLREMALKEGWLDPEAQTSSFVGSSLLRMQRPYLQENEMVALQRTFRFYVEFDKKRWPEIERVEMLLAANSPEAETEWGKLRDEFYQKKWGITESERKLTYAG